MDRTPEYYRAKAAQCRRDADRSPTDAGKSMMMFWADEFERAAKVIEAQQPPPPTAGQLRFGALGELVRR